MVGSLDHDLEEGGWTVIFGFHGFSSDNGIDGDAGG